MATPYSPGATPRLRFDKVALRLVQSVRAAVEAAVPNGLCVIFAVTAPIREPSKTLTGLIETIRARLSLGAGLGEHQAAIHANGVRVRVVKSRLAHAAKVAGFVHNPDPPPGALLDLAQALLAGVEAPDVAVSCGQTLRRVCEKVLEAESCAKVVAAVTQQRASRD